MNADREIRRQLLDMLKCGNAHFRFDAAVSGFPLREINRRLPNATYTPWHLLEHMRIAQWDILEFTRNPDHVSPHFPDGYWPKPDEMATANCWRKTIKDFQADLKAMERLVKDPKTDLAAPLPHARNYNVIMEVLTLAAHNSYCIGELVTIRRLLGLNPLKEPTKSAG